MRIPEPGPFGDTSLRAIVRAIRSAEPVNVRAGGWVELVMTCRTQRFVDRFFAIGPAINGLQTTFRRAILCGLGPPLAHTSSRKLRYDMHIDLGREDAEMLRDLLRQRIVELDKEINRTDSLAFKHELQQLDRAIERILGELSAALESQAAGQPR